MLIEIRTDSSSNWHPEPEVYIQNKKLKRLFVRQICHPIRTNVRLSEAPSLGKTIFEYDDKASGADDYRKLSLRLIHDDIRSKEAPKRN